MKRLFALFILLLAVACGNPMYNQIKAAEQNDVKVTLQRTACFGQCPIYKATFDLSNAKLQYFGERFVKTEGEREFDLTEEEVSRIQKKIVEVDYLTLEGKYDGPISDVPSCITTLSVQGEMVKEVTNRVDGPDRLKEYENLLDEILKVHLGEVEVM